MRYTRQLAGRARGHPGAPQPQRMDIPRGRARPAACDSDSSSDATGWRAFLLFFRNKQGHGTCYLLTEVAPGRAEQRSWLRIRNAV
jgi:hypothetical protein